MYQLWNRNKGQRTALSKAPRHQEAGVLRWLGRWSSHGGSKEEGEDREGETHVGGWLFGLESVVRCLMDCD